MVITLVDQALTAKDYEDDELYMYIPVFDLRIMRSFTVIVNNNNAGGGGFRNPLVNLEFEDLTLFSTVYVVE